MENSPNFEFNPDDFDPSLSELLDDLNSTMESENQKHLDSLRNSYLTQLQYRDQVLQKGIGREAIENMMIAAFERKVQNYFLYYLDGIFRHAKREERQDYIAEAFYETEGSQRSINRHTDGMDYSFSPTDIQGQVAAALLDDDKQAKKYIEGLYERKFIDKVRRELYI